MPEPTCSKKLRRMMANTRWIRIGVLVSFNLAVLCLVRPIAELIGWGTHSNVPAFLTTAPLSAVCLLAMMISPRWSVRTLTMIGALFVMLLVENALTSSGRLVCPSLSQIEKDASDFCVILVPAVLLVYLVTGFVDLSGSSRDEHSLRSRNRPSIAGLMIGMAALYLALVWSSEVQVEATRSLHHIARMAPEPTATEIADIRLDNLVEFAIYGPITAGLMLLGWWVGLSGLRSRVLLVFAVALGTCFYFLETSLVVRGAAAYSRNRSHLGE